MAGKGGGAWKVAYADFVTAMMAFFLVMWLVGQDQKTKQAVTRYFNNPQGFKTIGESTHPDARGNLFSTPDNGEVPSAKEIALGMGRDSYNTPGESSPSTKLISDHVFGDEDQLGYWQDMAEAEYVGAMQATPENSKEAARVASEHLAHQMREKLLKEIPRDVDPMYRDLLYKAMEDVNWLELGEDLVQNRKNKVHERQSPIH